MLQIKRTKLHHSNFFFRGSMPPNPPSKRMATPRVASPPPPTHKKVVGKIVVGKIVTKHVQNLVKSPQK